MNTCQAFATSAAKSKGMSYTAATKKFPRGCYKNSVYIDSCQTQEGHCVHCARANAILNLNPEGEA